MNPVTLAAAIAGGMAGSKVVDTGMKYARGNVLPMVSVLYAMGEWHEDRNKCRNSNNNQQ